MITQDDKNESADVINRQSFVLLSYLQVNVCSVSVINLAYLLVTFPYVCYHGCVKALRVVSMMFNKYSSTGTYSKKY